MITEMLLTFNLMFTMQCGTYKEREDAQRKLEVSNCSIPYLVHMYQAVSLDQFAELKIRLKETLRFKWKEEMTSKYALVSFDGGEDKEVQVSDQMWDDFNKVLSGEYDVRN